VPAATRFGPGEETRVKRLHVHVSVKDLETSVRFYSQLFAAEPAVRKPDYAKWMLQDPRVNFAISQRDRNPGVQHLGIEVEDCAELAEVYERLRRAEGPVIEEGETTCCYARSEKSWIDDPQSIKWETFLTTGESTVYGTDEIRPKSARQLEAPCCGPAGCPSRSS
jgi:catechol 2,3-dioxygenase-like lactoylglutathione lyase family enzyme